MLKPHGYYFNCDEKSLEWFIQCKNNFPEGKVHCEDREISDISSVSSEKGL